MERQKGRKVSLRMLFPPAQLPQGLQRLVQFLAGPGGGVGPQDAQGALIGAGGAGADGGLPVPDLLDGLVQVGAALRKGVPGQVGNMN